MKRLRMPLLGLVIAAVPLLVGLGASSQASGVIVAVDANPAGNTPRSVGSIERCVTASVGQPVEIDVVVPDPGIPADRGLSRFTLSLSYDPSIVRVTNANTTMLLAQAPASDFFEMPFHAPDGGGTYSAFAFDTGPSGIEPQGSAEVGPGVLARITLTPQSNGVSELSLTNVSLHDFTLFRPIELESVQAATIAVGAPCDQGTDTDDGGGNGANDAGAGGNGANDAGAGGNGGSGGTGGAGGPGVSGEAGGPDTGVGALAPAAGSIAIWAAIASGLGAAGLLASLGAFVSRLWRRR